MDKINSEIKKILGLEPSAGENEILENIAVCLGFEGNPSEGNIKRELDRKIIETEELLETASEEDKELLKEEYGLYKKFKEWFAVKPLDFSVPEMTAPKANKADKTATRKVPHKEFAQNKEFVQEPQKTAEEISAASAGFTMPQPPRRSKNSADSKKQADELCEEICSDDKKTALEALIKLYAMAADKDIFPEEFENYCSYIEKNADKSLIKKEAWYYAGEIRMKHEEAGKALENYEKALSIEGSKHCRASYRKAHMFAFKKIQTGESAKDILSLYYDAQNDPDIFIKASAYLEAANLCFESKEINDPLKAIEQLEHYLKISKDTGSENSRRQDAENILEKLKILKKAERPDSSAGDKYEAALFYVYLAERKENNFLFCRSRAEYFGKAVEWMDKAAAASSDADKEKYLEKKELYSKVTKILAEGRTSGKFTGKDEYDLGELYFRLGSLDEAIKHMENAASADYTETAARLKFFRIYKKGSSDKAAPEAVEALADEYMRQENYEQAEKQLLRIKNIRTAKEKLFKIYYKTAPDFSKAEKIGKELAEEELAAGGKNTHYRELYIRLLCLNGKAEKAVEPCKELLECGSVPAMYAYACLCENKIKGSEPEKALEYYEKAAASKHPAAMFKVFKLRSAAIANGKDNADENIKDDLVDYLNGAAKGGNADALYQRAVYKINGFEPLHFEKNSKNFSDGITDLEKAAEMGHAPSAAQLIKQYTDDGNIEKAIEMLEKFSRIVRSPDERELIPEDSGLRENNFAMPEDKDFSLILQSFSGITSENAVVRFAESLLKGSGKIQQNIPLALKLLHYLSDNKEKFSSKAAALLGEVYYLGISKVKIPADERPFQREEYISQSYSVERDMEKAEHYLEKCEDDWSKYYLARISIAKQDCSENDWKKAVDLFEKSGLPAAKCWLGDFHAEGNGVSQLPTKAREYYEDSSKAGFAAATIRLAKLLQEHKNIDDDAFFYYMMKAAAQGSNEAADALTKIIKEKNYSNRKILKVLEPIKDEFKKFVSKKTDMNCDALLCISAILAKKEGRKAEAEQFCAKIAEPYWQEKCR